ncbi:MAG: DUF2460 domain-containing protein [Candidatus Thiodiazotropha endolucinida]|nr:DUF2460 domain-containing protein [Candidatus Thiodiazotropha taylori]MCW4321604.1 DUF2460 domain-containing protein [Candidatus Thiodiazotropha taylori]
MAHLTKEYPSSFRPSYGSTVGVKYEVAVFPFSNLTEQRVALANGGRHTISLVYNTINLDQAKELVDFFMEAKGKLHSFDFPVFLLSNKGVIFKDRERVKVRFDQDSISYNLVEYNTVELNILLIEAA